MNHDQKAAAFYRAGVEKKEPPHVPCRVLVLTEVFGDFPFRGAGVAPGAMDCISNRLGAISVVARDGLLLGLKPGEFDVLEWRENTPPDTQTRDLFSEGL